MASVKLLAALVLVSFMGTTICAEEESEQPSTEAMEQLTKFGYMDEPSGDFAEIGTVENYRAALRRYQQFTGLKVTGVYDDATKRQMRKPRCGNTDKNVLTGRRRRRRYVLAGSRWGTTDITYKIVRFSPDLSQQQQESEIERAFKVWSDNSALTFRRVSTSSTAIIEIDFAAGDHGDGNPFDGTGNVLAHAYFPSRKPIGGDSHFDEDENWTVGTSEGTNLFQVAAHEFGHALGLDHSDVRNALMYPYYSGYVSDFTLDQDDIDGIQALYGRNEEMMPDTSTTTTSTTTTTTAPTTTTTTPTTTTKPPTTTTTPTTTTSKPTITTTTSTTRTTTPPTTTTTSTTTTTTSTPSTTTTSSNPMAPNLCEDPSIEASALYQYYNGQVLYAFKDGHVMQMTATSTITPVPIENSIFRGGPSGKIIAALFWPSSYGRRGRYYYIVSRARTYLFKGSQVWRYDERGLLPGYPVAVSEEFPGIPDDIDGAVRYPHNGLTYFFKGEEYWRYRRGYGVDQGYPRDIERYWYGIPADIDDAFELRNGYTYFFKGESLYRLSPSNQVVEFSLRDLYRCSDGSSEEVREMKLEGQGFLVVGEATSSAEVTEITTSDVTTGSVYTTSTAIYDDDDGLTTSNSLNLYPTVTTLLISLAFSLMW